MDEQTRYETVDLPFYQNEVASILPPVILDFHTHTWSADDWGARPWQSKAKGGKYMVSLDQYPPEQLLADGRRCFPDRTYEAVCFGYPTPAADWDKDTAFVAAAGQHEHLYPLVLAGPALNVSRERYDQAFATGGFLGFKVFLPWFGDDYGNRRVQDMVGPTELALANERRLVILLHVPRSGRLADPEIQQGVEWLAKTCPDAQIVLAHCGRCYLPAEMKAAIGSIRDLPNVSMDTSMVMDSLVLTRVLDTLGSARVLYATDFPVAAMRGRRVRVMDHWVDVVLDAYPESAFRVQSDGIRATFMATEIVVAIRDAAERVGLSTAELHGVFHDNGMRLLENVMGGEQRQRVRERWRATADT